MKKYCVLYNPIAEGGIGNELFNNQILPCFNKLPTLPLGIFKTSINLNHIWETIIELNPDFVFVCGGDGTINQVINEMLNSKEIPIAILPFGNGNDFSRCLYFSRDYSYLIPYLYHSSPKRVDIGKIQFKTKTHYFLNEMSIGISSNVLNSVRQSSLPKNWAFMVYGITNQLFPEKQHLTYKTDNIQEDTNDVKLLTISNGKFFGNGMNIQPDASIDDGKFDVSVVENTGIIDTLSIMNAVYNGEKYPSVKYFTCDKIAINGNGVVEADGEILEKLPCNVYNLKQKIYIIY